MTRLKTVAMASPLFYMKGLSAVDFFWASDHWPKVRIKKVSKSFSHNMFLSN